MSKKTKDADREKILADVEADERLLKSVVIDGQEIPCEVCGGLLKYYAPGSGRPPGVYCPTGCTKIYFNMSGPKTSTADGK